MVDVRIVAVAVALAVIVGTSGLPQRHGVAERRQLPKIHELLSNGHRQEIQPLISTEIVNMRNTPTLKLTNTHSTELHIPLEAKQPCEEAKKTAHLLHQLLGIKYGSDSHLTTLQATQPKVNHDVTIIKEGENTVFSPKNPTEVLISTGSSLEGNSSVSENLSIYSEETDLPTGLKPSGQLLVGDQSFETAESSEQSTINKKSYEIDNDIEKAVSTLSSEEAVASTQGGDSLDFNKLVDLPGESAEGEQQSSSAKPLEVVPELEHDAYEGKAEEEKPREEQSGDFKEVNAALALTGETKETKISSESNEEQKSSDLTKTFENEEKLEDKVRIENIFINEAEYINGSEEENTNSDEFEEFENSAESNESEPLSEEDHDITLETKDVNSNENGSSKDFNGISSEGFGNSSDQNVSNERNVNVHVGNLGDNYNGVEDETGDESESCEEDDGGENDIEEEKTDEILGGSSDEDEMENYFPSMEDDVESSEEDNVESSEEDNAESSEEDNAESSEEDDIESSEEDDIESIENYFPSMEDDVESSEEDDIESIENYFPSMDDVESSEEDDIESIEEFQSEGTGDEINQEQTSNCSECTGTNELEDYTDYIIEEQKKCDCKNEGVKVLEDSKSIKSGSSCEEKIEKVLMVLMPTEAERIRDALSYAFSGDHNRRSIKKLPSPLDSNFLAELQKSAKVGRPEDISSPVIPSLALPKPVPPVDGRKSLPRYRLSSNYHLVSPSHTPTPLRHPGYSELPLSSYNRRLYYHRPAYLFS